MTDDQGWYQRKLAAVRQPQQQPQQHAQHQGYRPPPPQYQPQSQQPQQQYQQPPPQPPPQAPDRVTVENLWDSMKFWRGGKAHKDNPYPCPQCGSNNFFSSIQSSRRGPPPAPHCFACGYNDGMFTQGLQSSWQH